ncbi:MAG: hypothetical protein HYV27_12245 [Candidatus Hydrogenedentes bacterium]|nr:hypothetical protein [Candidatus Hydrogenedentota bacterium]
MGELAIIFSFVLLLSGMVLAFVYGMVMLSARRKQDKLTGRDEAQSLQEFHRLLLAMERRIDSLETLLVDRADRPRSQSLTEFE